MREASKYCHTCGVTKTKDNCYFDSTRGAFSSYCRNCYLTYVSERRRAKRIAEGKRVYINRREEDVNGLRTCLGCTGAYPATEEYFYASKGKLKYICKECNNNHQRKRLNLFSDFGNAILLADEIFSRSKNFRRLAQQCLQEREGKAGLL